MCKHLKIQLMVLFLRVSQICIDNFYIAVEVFSSKCSVCVCKQAEGTSQVCSYLPAEFLFFSVREY